MFFPRISPDVGGLNLRGGELWVFTIADDDQLFPPSSPVPLTETFSLSLSHAQSQESPQMRTHKKHTYAEEMKMRQWRSIGGRDQGVSRRKTTDFHERRKEKILFSESFSSFAHMRYGDSLCTFIPLKKRRWTIFRS